VESNVRGLGKPAVVANQNYLVCSSTTIVSLGSRVSFWKPEQQATVPDLSFQFCLREQVRFLDPWEFRKSELLVLPVEHMEIRFGKRYSSSLKVLSTGSHFSPSLEFGAPSRTSTSTPPILGPLGFSRSPFA
jgi:hypothetical protein